MCMWRKSFLFSPRCTIFWGSTFLSFTIRILAIRIMWDFIPLLKLNCIQTLYTVYLWGNIDWRPHPFLYTKTHDTHATHSLMKVSGLKMMFTVAMKVIGFMTSASCWSTHWSLPRNSLIQLVTEFNLEVVSSTFTNKMIDTNMYWELSCFWGWSAMRGRTVAKV